MGAMPLYDWTPVWRVLALGATVAALPLGWTVWRQRHAPRLLDSLAMVSWFLVLDLILVGAFTRLTDSGLGCPDWPGCYGAGTPVGASVHIDQAQALMPTGPVTGGKAWIEMVHRYVATAFGALLLVLTVLHWRARAKLEAGAPGWTMSLAALLWVCVQGAFGAWTVTMKLWPAIVSLHLLGALVLLALLTALNARLAQARQGLPRVALAQPWYVLLLVALAALLVQIMLGAWLSSNYAVLACDEFPLCQGSGWPEMDFAQGYGLWHPLGLDGQGRYLTLPALTAIHMGHRLFAAVAFLAVGALAWCIRSEPALRWQGNALLVLLVAQAATGLGNVLLGWPLLAALLHTGGAAMLLMALVWLLCRVRALPPNTRGA